MDKLGPPLRTGRDVQRLYDSDTKSDSTIKRPNELLPINKPLVPNPRSQASYLNLSLAITEAGTVKTRTSTPPSLARSAGTAALASKRKTYNAESYSSRSDGKLGYDSGDCSSSANGGSSKSSEGNSPVQLSKFCHECGTRYPVDWAKFCCECGIRRMVL